MQRYYANLIGWGKGLPARTVTNDDLAQRIDTTDEWIRSRSGIRERRLVSDGETTATLSVAAAQQALDRAGLTGADLDLILIASSSPDYLTPPVSSMVQHALGATRAGAMTLMVGCTGFVYGLVTAEQFIATGAATTVLVVGAETISRNLDWNDRTTCVLFGDGAGAVILQATDQPCGSRAHVLGSDGAGFEHLIIHSGGCALPNTHERLDEGLQYLRMNGREVFKFASAKMVEALAEVVAKAGATAADIDLLIPHQANIRIIEYAAEMGGIPMDKVYVNLDRYGNTSAATVPIALCECLEQGLAKPGDTLALVGFGAGLTWAASLFDLGTMLPRPISSTLSSTESLASAV